MNKPSKEMKMVMFVELKSNNHCLRHITVCVHKRFVKISHRTLSNMPMLGTTLMKL